MSTTMTGFAAQRCAPWILLLAEVRYDEVRPGLDKAFPFPFVYALSPHLVARHTHGHPAHILGILYLHVPVAECQKLAAPKVVLGDNLPDEHSLREALVIVQSAVRATVEI